MRRVFYIFIGICFSLSSASAKVYTYSEKETVIGFLQTYCVKENESLIEIARKFDLGFNEIADANPGLDAFVPQEGARVTIPSLWVLPDTASGNEIVINLSEMRLYYFFRSGDLKTVCTYPIGIGSDDNNTPLGTFDIIEKIVDPSWHVPASILAEKPYLPEMVPPGPDNPLGSHALRLSAGELLIHGTNRPYGIGRRVSHGCIRLYPEDIPQLFHAVPVGTKVSIVRQPVKAGVLKGKVYLEVHRDGQLGMDYFSETARLLVNEGVFQKIDTVKALHVLDAKSGIPTDISTAEPGR